MFVDGCFSRRSLSYRQQVWHGCPKHATWPKAHAAFWRKKIRANMARDREVGRVLRRLGWRVVRVWEHELGRRDEAKLVRRLLSNLGRSA